MTTHRNLKPHYAEPKGKSGPVIVVKKGEVMSEPTPTDAAHALGFREGYKLAETRCQEARANADRELREALEILVKAVEDAQDIDDTVLIMASIKGRDVLEERKS